MQKKKIKHRGYWSKEKCYKAAKKCKTISEFKKRYDTAYKLCLKNKWQAEFYIHMQSLKKPNGYWNKENCLELAKNISSRTNFIKNHQFVYNVIQKNKWNNECFAHMKELKKPNGHWTKERCIKEAKKYKTKKEWKEKSYNSRSICIKNKWTDECCKHMKPLGNLMKRMVYAYEFSDKKVYVGLTYDEKTRQREHFKDIKKRKKSSVYNHYVLVKEIPLYIKITKTYINYDKAQQIERDTIQKYKSSGWNILNRIKAGGLGGNIIKWTKEKCIEDAIKFKFRSDWNKSSPGAYDAAHRNKWLDVCCNHMQKKVNN